MKTETKKVIFVLDSFWPNQDGVSTVVQYLSAGLAKRGHIVEVLTNAKDRELPKEEMHEGVHIRRIKVETRWPFYFRAMDEDSNIQAYRGEIERFNPDVIIVESLRSWTNDWFVEFSEEFACKKMLHLHSDILNYKEYGVSKIDFKVRNIGNILYQARMQYKMRFYWKKIYGQLDKYNAIFYLSPGLKGIEKYQKKGSAKTYLLENAVDDIFFTIQAQHNESAKDHCRFLCVANYMENKNQGMLIEAYAKANFDKTTELVFVGNGNHKYMESLKRQAEGLIEKETVEKKVIFFRGITRDETIDEYRKADVFVLPSKSEASSMVVREAAACKMAVISTNVGDASQIPGCQIVYSKEEMITALERNADDIAYRSRHAERLAEWALEKCKREKAVSVLENAINEI